MDPLGCLHHWLSSHTAHSLSPSPYPVPVICSPYLGIPLSFVKCFDKCGHFLFIFFTFCASHESFLKALNHFHHCSASSRLKSLSEYMLIHHHSLCDPHVSSTLFTLGFNLLLVANSSVPLLPQGAHPCFSCLHSSQWESMESKSSGPELLAYGLLPKSSFQTFPFCMSFTAASSPASSTQPKRQKWGPLQGWLTDHLRQCTVTRLPYFWSPPAL